MCIKGDASRLAGADRGRTLGDRLQTPPAICTHTGNTTVMSNNENRYIHPAGKETP
jgi:hypothetical protein